MFRARLHHPPALLRSSALRFALTISFAWGCGNGQDSTYLAYSFESSELEPSRRSEESVDLWGFCPEDITPAAAFPRIEATFAVDTVNIQTAYWLPPRAPDVSAGYTAPLITWERTTISGLSTEPLVLTGYFSQTYAPRPQNSGGQYIFDPRLDPGTSTASLAELDGADINYLIVVDHDGLEDELWVLGLDGVLRRL